MVEFKIIASWIRPQSGQIQDQQRTWIRPLSILNSTIVVVKFKIIIGLSILNSTTEWSNSRSTSILNSTTMWSNSRSIAPRIPPPWSTSRSTSSYTYIYSLYICIYIYIYIYTNYIYIILYNLYISTNILDV